MQISCNIDVHHVTRVEGHGDIHVSIKDGKIIDARWEVVETPRYFEVMLKGKHYTTAGILTARICGICSIGHALASVRATEAAFGTKIPPLAEKLRLLCKHGETLQSHSLHVIFLALPDFLGLPSAIPLMELNPEAFAVAARLKGLANRLSDVVAGRTTHPVSIQVGGIARRPKTKILLQLKEDLLASVADLNVVADIAATFEIPDFSRETEFVSLKGTDEYPWIGGDLISTDGVLREEHDYLAMTNEWVTENNTTKWAKLSRSSMAVGALARINNNYDLLHPVAKEIAEKLGLKAVCHNPYMNTVAQIVEMVHATFDSIRLIDEIIEAPEDAPIMAKVIPKAGRGVSAVEVPRGILYHDYLYDDEGRVVKANCIIPTTQNNANIHEDMFALAEYGVANKLEDKRIELLCEMLVRAYDPCISCSVH